MAVLELQPIEPAEPYSKLRYEGVELAGIAYDYQLKWNDRTEAWYLYIQRSDGSTPPVNGVKVVVNFALGQRYTGRGPVDGTLLLIDQGGGNAADRPTFEGLGHRWRLGWVDDSELTPIDLTPDYTIVMD